MGDGNSYDVLIIGSSPLMLLIALEKRRAGRRVCVLDKADDVGGVWRTVHVANGLQVEYACHLVEDFPGVYEYLEGATGVKFEALDVQPIRVLGNGYRFRYSSRTTIFLATVWAVGLLILHGLRRVLSTPTELERERVAVLKRKIDDFFRHHVGMLLTGATVKAPIDGYAEFIRSLKAQCEANGVSFRRFEVTSATDNGREWTLADRSGAKLRAAEIHATTSATLMKSRHGEFRSRPAQGATTHSVLVEIPHFHVREPVSYAAFWKDPEVVRVSRIDRREPHGKGLIYLVQLRKGISLERSEVVGVVNRCLTRCGVISEPGSASVTAEIQCSHTPHSRQLPAGVIARGFWTHSSVGNLASGVARWLVGRQPRAELAMRGNGLYLVKSLVSRGPTFLLIYLKESVLFDLANGTNTHLRVPTVEQEGRVASRLQDGLLYVASFTSVVRTTLRIAKEILGEPGFTEAQFVDLGCGKGKALLIYTKEFSSGGGLPAVGIEYDRRLCHIASSNLARVKGAKGRATVHCDSAVNVGRYVRGRLLIAYLYNSFQGETLRSVLTTLATYRHLLIYVDPVERDALAEYGYSVVAENHGKYNADTWLIATSRGLRKP